MALNGTNETERRQTTDDRGIRELALEQGRLIDITRVTTEEGIRCPVAISQELWRRHGNTTEVDLHSANVVYWLARAMAQVAAGRRNYRETKTPFGELWHFTFEYLPEESDWTKIAVKSVLGPDDNGDPVITVLLATEESTEWELGLRPENYPMLQEDISVTRDEDGLTVRFHATGIQRGDLSHFLGTFGARLFNDPSAAQALFGRLRYEFDGYDEQLHPVRRNLPPLQEFLRTLHGTWPYWFLFSDWESDTPLRMFRLAYPGLLLVSQMKSVSRHAPQMVLEAEQAIEAECQTMTAALLKAGHLPAQVARQCKVITRLLDLPSWLVASLPPNT